MLACLECLPEHEAREARVKDLEAALLLALDRKAAQAVQAGNTEDLTSVAQARLGWLLESVRFLLTF